VGCARGIAGYGLSDRWYYILQHLAGDRYGSHRKRDATASSNVSQLSLACTAERSEDSCAGRHRAARRSAASICSSPRSEL